MKIRIYVVGMILLILTSACNDYTISTKINEDGSIERIIRIDSYSGSGRPESLPFYVDNTWKSRIEKSANDTTKETMFYSKTFPNAEELNKELAKGSKTKSVAKLEKKFRWFYTYFYYTETYKKTNPFKTIPLDNFFSAKEIDSLNTGLMSRGLSKKVDDVLSKCIVEELMDSISAVAQRNSLYDSNKLNLLKEKIYAKELDTADKLIKEMEIIYGNKSVLVLKPDLERIFKGIENKMEYYMNPSNSVSFTANVVMPGLILNTNASTVEGNKLTWKPESENYVFTDYKITAESRVANTWATLATGITVFVLILILLVPVLRRKRYI